MIEKIALYLAKKIQSNTSEQEPDPEDTDVLRYGIECIINTAIPVLIFFIYSIFNKMCMEMLLWILSFLILRNYIGGYHAATNMKCILLSTLFGITSLFVIQHISSISVIIIGITYCVFVVVILFCKPIVYNISQNNTQKQVRTLLQKSIVTLFIEFCLCLILNHLTPFYGNAVFIGSCSAMVLYIPGKFKI